MHKMFQSVWIFISIFSLSSAIIYKLNDAEYQRMPPVFFLDEYEPCMVEENSTYCMLQLHLYADPGNELMHMINEYSSLRFKHYNHSIIDRGVCVKKSCHKYISSNTTEDLTRSLEACLNDSLRSEYGLNAKVSTLYYCDHYNEPLEIDDWDWTVLTVIFGLVIVTIVGSAYDYFTRKQHERASGNENSMLLSFSIMRNWKRLTNTESNDVKLWDLQFFHGARVVSNVLTILLHALITFITGFARNPHDVEKAFESPFYHMIFNGMNIVQVFFFISGFLTSYLLQMEERKRSFTLRDIPKIMLLRFSRLVPVLMISLALSTTWLRHVGSGPMWKLFVTGSIVADCRNYGWRHLFFINNYSDDSKCCLLPTWQLAAETQVFLVAVTAYVMTRGRSRRIVLGILLLLSAVAPAVHTMLNDLDGVIVAPQFTRTLSGGTFWLQHILGHCNLPCFIIGMATASLLSDWQKKSSHLISTKWCSLVQYLSILAIPLILYSGRIFYDNAPQASLFVRAIHSSAVRLLLGLTTALAIATFLSKTPTYLKAAFEWRFWVVPSRLTYCVFLLHMMLVHVIMGSRTQLAYFSFFNIMKVLLFIVVVSYVISVPIYLMVEAPFTVLFKNLFQKQTPRSNFHKNGTSAANVISTVNTTSFRNASSAVDKTSIVNRSLAVHQTLAANGISLDYVILTSNGTSDVNENIKEKKL